MLSHSQKAKLILERASWICQKSILAAGAGREQGGQKDGLQQACVSWF